VVGQLLIHRYDPLTWPHATISVTLGALLSLLVRLILENASGGTQVCERSAGRCLSIVEAVLTPLDGETIAYSPI
jgi:hypothetical protein